MSEPTKRDFWSVYAMPIVLAVVLSSYVFQVVAGWRLLSIQAKVERRVDELLERTREIRAEADELREGLRGGLDVGPRYRVPVESLPPGTPIFQDPSTWQAPPE